MFLKVHINQLFKDLVFLKIYNYNNIIHNIIRKWLLKDILPLKIHILSKNKQTGLSLRNYIKKKNNIFLLYNNYIDNYNIKLVILNKKIIILIINKNN